MRPLRSATDEVFIVVPLEAHAQLQGLLSQEQVRSVIKPRELGRSTACTADKLGSRYGVLPSEGHIWQC